MASCQNEEYDYQSLLDDNYRLVFQSPVLPYVRYDLTRDSLIGVHTVTIKDTLVLSNSDKNKIANLFFKNEIYKNSGEQFIIGEIWIIPAFNYKIEVYKKDKLVSSLNVNSMYEPEVFIFRNRKEQRIVEFKNGVWEILEKYKQYKNMEDTLTLINRKEPIILM